MKKKDLVFSLLVGLGLLVLFLLILKCLSTGTVTIANKTSKWTLPISTDSNLGGTLVAPGPGAVEGGIEGAIIGAGAGSVIGSAFPLQQALESLFGFGYGLQPSGPMILEWTHGSPLSVLFRNC